MPKFFAFESVAALFIMTTASTCAYMYVPPTMNIGSTLRVGLNKGLNQIDNMALPRAVFPANEERIDAVVPESPVPTSCQVVGNIPPSCYGMLARNGGNAKMPIKHNYFLFDGDGMIHSVRLSSGDQCTYSATYVHTHRVQDEERMKEAVHGKVGDLRFGLGTLVHLATNAIRTATGIIGTCESLANTSLLFHKPSGSLLALQEMGAPYALQPSPQNSRLDTLGQTTFGSVLQGRFGEPFTAHPKIDPTDGTMYAFGYSFLPTGGGSPLRFHRIRHCNQQLLQSIDIPIRRAVMQHDFCITESHAVFFDNPLVFNLAKMTNGLPFEFKKEYGSRIGIVPLRAKSGSEVHWFDLPQAAFLFHTLNAWNEEVDDEGTPTKITAIVSQWDDMPVFDKLTTEPNPYRIRVWKYGMDLVTGELYCNEEIGDPSDDRFNLDFPIVPPKLVGRKTKYGYFCMYDRENEDSVSGYMKVDLEKRGKDAIVGKILYGENVYGGEAQFVPSLDPKAKEDDGHLMVFVNIANPGEHVESELRIYSTIDMSSEPVATVKIPSLVPSGLHGTFIPESDLTSRGTPREVTLDVAPYSTAGPWIS